MKTPAKLLLDRLTEIMWFRTILPEEGKAIEIFEDFLAIEGATVVTDQPFRSSPFVNQTDDMVRVTIDMPRHSWRKLRTRIGCAPEPPQPGFASPAFDDYPEPDPESLTCHGCKADACRYRGDWYNTDGDCLASK